jgi:threonyl-tRNA synthetase
MNSIEIKRHSLEHVMVLAAKRVLALELKLGVGPVIENGFYQDFDYPVAEDLLPLIEAEMKKIIAENLAFERRIVAIDQAIEIFGGREQIYKVELLRDIRDFGTTRADRNISSEDAAVLESSEAGVVSLYAVGSHEDLCRGPHVARTGDLEGMAFKLDRIAGAYWRGDEKNKMLSRIYALAFENQAELDNVLHQREELRKRDHRKLGEVLELFFFDSSASGMPYWLPKGMKVRNLLFSFWRQYHEALGYQEIAAPLLNKRELWEISGHWAHYKSDMFSFQAADGEEWALKPMNCANAMRVWQHKPRSYRDLPLRLSDTDMLHRNERAGSLCGLFRARCFCQDDSHNFVSEEQIFSEIKAILRIVDDFYSVFGLLGNVRLYLSTRPDEFMGDIQSWDRAEAELQNVLKETALPWKIKPKDGAFYGPKIDVHLIDALGREWQCGTIQLDFQLPKNFGLMYTDRDGSRKMPIVIHRVIYGSVERFLGIVLEHFAGRLPFWIVPEQVRIIPVNGEVLDYAERLRVLFSQICIHKPVRHNSIRCAMDSREETLRRKIREAELQKIPLICVVGKKEQGAETISIRSKNGEQCVALGDFESWLHSWLLQ